MGRSWRRRATMARSGSGRCPRRSDGRLTRAGFRLRASKMLVHDLNRGAAMGSLADALPPEIAAQVHPEWRANEAAYWAARDGLLADYWGLWFCVADVAVAA